MLVNNQNGPERSTEVNLAGVYCRTDVAMDTLVTLRAETRAPFTAVQDGFERAIRWFTAVEAACNRFDPTSELSLLCSQVGEPVMVSPILLEAVAFAVEVARGTGGAFDPAIGARQQQRGFARSYLTDRVETEFPAADGGQADYRDVQVNRRNRTIKLRRPLVLDLGAVAKGLAIDLAAHELTSFERYAVDAGGDWYGGGMAPAWRVGVQHPRYPDALLTTVEILDGAACTSGDYERVANESGEHHLLDPHTGRSPHGVISVTVVAPSAIVADALATAAFVLGPRKGLRLLLQQGVNGLIVTAHDEWLTTPGFQECLGRTTPG